MTGTSTIASALLAAAVTIGLAAPVDAEPPRGSITIERIADIKYPTNPAWSPDGHRVAFLWDAAGKQDLFVVTPGSAPVPLTDFAVDPDLLRVGHRRLRLGVERRDPVRPKTASCGRCRRRTATPARMTAARWPMPARSRCHPIGSTSGSCGAARSGWASVAAGTAAAAHQSAGRSRLRRCRCSRRTAAGWRSPRRAAGSSPRTCRGTARWCARWRTSRASGGSASSRRRAATWRGFRRSARPAACSSPATASLVYQELSPDGKTREIKTAGAGALPRVLWRDRDDKWVVADQSRRPSCSSRPTASRSRSSAIAAGGSTST